MSPALFARYGRLLACAVLLIVACTARLAGQMQPHSRFEGELLPVVSCGNDKLVVLQKGRKREAAFSDFENRQGPGFALGRVEISGIVADLDPLKDAPVKVRTDPSAVQFRYSAELTSDRTMDDCYALLVFVTNGSIGTDFIKIGRLEAGRPRRIERDLRTRAESVGHLHVFSETLEVRTNLVPDPYQVAEYYKALAARSRGVPALELVKSERSYRHVLSRDGRMLATTRDRETHYSIIVYDLESMKLVCDKPFGEDDKGVYSLTWVSETELAFVYDNKLHLLDIAKGTVERIKEHVEAVIFSLPDQRDVLVLANYTPDQGGWICKFNVHTRKAYDAEDRWNGASILDPQGNVRIRRTIDHTGLKFYYRPTVGSAWRMLDDDVKQEGLRFNLRGKDVLDRKADLHSIGPDGDTLYISSRANSDLFELAAFSMAQGRITKTIAKHPKYDLTTGDDGQTALLFNDATAELLGIIFEGQKHQVVWLHPVFATAQKAMEAQFPNHVCLPQAWSPNAETIIFFTFSDRDPGGYYVYRPRTATLVPLLLLSDRLKDRALAVTQPITFQARDGAKIPAYVTWPPETSNEPMPMVVQVHGGPTARDSWGFHASDQFLATRGYVVLRVNYRGSSGYGAAFQLAGLRARLDTVVLDDIADGTKHLIATGKVDPSRVGVMGGSFGGWATYMSLIKYPDLYRAGVAMAAVSHWRAALREDRWYSSSGFGYSFWKSLLDRENFKEDEPFIDPLLRASELKQPIYIMHGERDYIVDASEAKLMLEALRKHNPQVQARSFPLAGHGTTRIADRVTELNEIGMFFDRHLAKREPSPPAATP